MKKTVYLMTTLRLLSRISLPDRQNPRMMKWQKYSVVGDGEGSVGLPVDLVEAPKGWETVDGKQAGESPEELAGQQGEPPGV